VAQNLDDIIRELDAGYAPSRQLINQRIDVLPAQGEAEIAGLNATKDQAFNDITAGARDRGMGFSGIPLAEQAQYTASSFLPAVAKVRQSQNDVRTSLLDALNNTNLDQRKTAMTLRESQLNRDLEREKEEAARRAASQSSDAFKKIFEQQNQGQSSLSLPGATLKNPKLGGKGGYAFTFGSKPISAVGFAQVNNLEPADIIYTMASNGDAVAAQAYRDIVNNKNTITPAIARKYSSLFWGTNLLNAPQSVTVKSGRSGGGGW
jgi:hypothetical protein